MSSSVHREDRALRRILRLTASALLAAVVTLALTACGSDEGTRGLQPANEEAVPNSDAEDAKTRAEREADLTRELREPDDTP